MRFAVVLLGLALIASGCTVARRDGATSTTPSSNDPASQGLGFTTIEQGYNSGIQDEATLTEAFHSNASFQAFWARHKSTQTEAGTPQVDFTTTIVVAIVGAQKPSGGHTLTIKEVRPTDAGFLVLYSTESPGANCGTGAALTQPFHIVSFPRGNRVGTQVTFEFQGNSIYDCEP